MELYAGHLHRDLNENASERGPVSLLKSLSAQAGV